MRLYLDSNAIILSHEGAPPLQQEIVERIVQTCLQPRGVAMTSLLSRLECRVKPLREGAGQLLAHYDFLFGKSGLLVLDISAAVVERAAELRAKYAFKTPDAIHLASALEFTADVFLTGDKALTKCPGLTVELLPSLRMN